MIILQDDMRNIPRSEWEDLLESLPSCERMEITRESYKKDASFDEDDTINVKGGDA